MNENSSSSEPQESQDKTQISTSRNKNVKPFKRNPNLSYIVHALLHLSQFMTVLAIEAFHHIHHLINDKLHEEDPKISQLRDERHPIFIVIPLCMLMSLFLGVMWIVSTKIWKKIELGLIGCSSGAFLMLLCAIFSMRHAQLYINIETISDEDLLHHPIFIHSFTECILSIFALASYLLHFWLFYECWRWRLKEQKLKDTTNIPRADSIHGTPSKSTDNPDDLLPPGFLRRHQRQSIETSDRQKVETVEDEPVILYCFCIDCWNYLRHRSNKWHNNYQCEDVDVV